MHMSTYRAEARGGEFGFSHFCWLQISLQIFTVFTFTFAHSNFHVLLDFGIFLFFLFWNGQYIFKHISQRGTGLFKRSVIQVLRWPTISKSHTLLPRSLDGSDPDPFSHEHSLYRSATGTQRKVHSNIFHLSYLSTKITTDLLLHSGLQIIGKRQRLAER